MSVRKLIVGTVSIVVGVPLLALLVVTAAFYAFLYVPERANATMVVDGQEREYLLYVPSSLDRSKPAALVISLHGAAVWPGTQRRMSNWNALADEKGFIVVYPSGASVTGSRTATGIIPKAWLITKKGFERDTRFIGMLVEKLEADYRIDPARIYIEGLSNGGGMAFALSCVMPERIAAIGMVAAAQVLPWTWCTDKHAVPMIAFHGTADTVVPYRGGRAWSNPLPYPDVETWARNWSRRNGCDATPAESRLGSDVTRIQYGNCAQGAAVVLYRVEGGGHTWPGGEGFPEWLLGPTTRTIDATRELWKFFEAHPYNRAASLAPRSSTPSSGQVHPGS